MGDRQKRALFQMVIVGFLVIIMGELCKNYWLPYVDQYGMRWKYKKEIVHEEANGAVAVYGVYTNNRALTYEDIEKEKNRLPIDKQFVVVSQEWNWDGVDDGEQEFISEPYIVTDTGISYTKEEYETALLFFDSHTINCASFKIEEETVATSKPFSYEEDMLMLTAEDEVQEKGFVYSAEEQRVEASPGQNEEWNPALSRNEAVKRAKEETSMDYRIVKAAIDSKAGMWRIGFGDKEYGNHNQYVYMGMDGLTKKIVITTRWLD